MYDLSIDQAVAFYESGVWKKMTSPELAAFQIAQERLCVPFEVFHRAVEETIGRRIYVHEFSMNRGGLRVEIQGKAKCPTMAEIIAMFPVEKAIGSILFIH